MFLYLYAIRDEQPNVQAAAQFYVLEQAAAQGSVSAQYNLGVMSYNGEGVERNFTKAIEYLEQAAAQGNAPAQQALRQIRSAYVR